MKLNKQWKSLARDQKRAWMTWAKNNRVMLEDGNLRRVSGQKAFTVILNNRAIAGELAHPTLLPAQVTWLTGALSMRDAGPFTISGGYVGFRVELELADATKWFVWATAPVGAEESDPHRRLRFVKCQAMIAMGVNEITPNMGAQYAAVNGSWDGPGEEGEWPSPMFIWFRVHQYASGQLGPGVMMKGPIQLEL